MNNSQHCEAKCPTSESPSQCDFDTLLGALWSKNETFNSQATKVQSDRINEDLDKLNLRRQQDEERTAARKYRDEQIVKSRKAEDEGYERARACFKDEEAAVSGRDIPSRESNIKTWNIFRMVNHETFHSILGVLAGHYLGQHHDRKQIVGSETFKEHDVPAGSVLGCEGSTNSIKVQSPEPDIVGAGLEKEPAPSNQGRLVCGICGAQFRGPAGLRKHEKRHEHGRPHPCPQPDCNKPTRSRGLTRKHSNMVSCFHSQTCCILTSSSQDREEESCQRDQAIQ